MRLYIFLSIVLLTVSCTLAERRAALHDLALHTQVLTKDLDPTVDSDGDGDPTNDIDNKAEVIGGLIGLVSRNPTLSGLATVLGGAAAFVGSRYLRRRLRK